MKEKHKVGLSETPNADAQEEEQVKAWLETIARTKKWRDDIGEKAGWKRFVQSFENNWEWLKRQVSIPVIPINLVFAYVKTEIARLYFRNPWITVNAKRVEDVGAAQIAEQLINYTWGEINLKSHIKLALTDAILVGHGWIKVGYSAQFGTVESKEPDKRGPGRPKKEETEVDSNVYVKAENAFAYHVPYKDVLFDPSATWPPTSNSRWMAIRTVKPLRAIKESNIYKNTEDLQPISDEKKEGTLSQDVKSAELWEIYDRDHNKVVTVSQGSKKYLREIDYPDYLGDSFPMVMFGFNPVPGKPYPISDIAPIEGQIVELTKMMAIMLNHLKRWNRQIFMRPGMMTDESKAQFKDAVDGAIIEMQGDFGKDFFIPPYAPVQQDIYGVWNLVMDMWRNISGQSDVERGAPAKSNTRTLGELRLSLQGGRSRADEKVDVLEDAISEVARKLLMIMQKKYDLPKIVRIVGEKSMSRAMLDQRPSATGDLKDKAYTSDTSFSATKDDIHGEMDVDTQAGSTTPINKEMKIGAYEKVIEAAPALGMNMQSRAFRELLREYFREIDIKPLERIIDIAEQESQQQKPNPDMMKAQMDMQVKQQEAAIKAKTEQQKAQLSLQTEQAKSQLQLQALQAKTQADIVKAKTDIEKAQFHMQHDVLKAILKTVREPEPAGEEK